jgi:hypothetical protein
MWSFAVRDGDGLFDHTPSLLQVMRTLQQELTFQDAIGPFGQCVLITPSSGRTLPSHEQANQNENTYAAEYGT